MGAAAEEGAGDAPLELVGDLLGCIMGGNYERALVLCKEVLALEPHNVTVQQFLPVIREALDLGIGGSDEDSGGSDEGESADEDIPEEVAGEGAVGNTNEESGGEDDDDEDDEDDEDEGDEDDEDEDDEDDESPVKGTNPDFHPSGVLFRQGMTNLTVSLDKSMAAMSLGSTDAGARK